MWIRNAHGGAWHLNNTGNETGSLPECGAAPTGAEAKRQERLPQRGLCLDCLRIHVSHLRGVAEGCDIAVKQASAEQQRAASALSSINRRQGMYPRLTELPEVVRALDKTRSEAKYLLWRARAHCRAGLPGLYREFERAQRRESDAFDAADGDHKAPEVQEATARRDECFARLSSSIVRSGEPAWVEWLGAFEEYERTLRDWHKLQSEVDRLPGLEKLAIQRAAATRDRLDVARAASTRARSELDKANDLLRRIESGVEDDTDGADAADHLDLGAAEARAEDRRRSARAAAAALRATAAAEALERGVVAPGLFVVLRDVGADEELRLYVAHPEEHEGAGFADPSMLLTAESPLGKAVLGQSAGAVVRVTAPGGATTYEVLAVEAV